jgi:hypothetical protein
MINFVSVGFIIILATISTCTHATEHKKVPTLTVRKVAGPFSGHNDEIMAILDVEESLIWTRGNLDDSVRGWIEEAQRYAKPRCMQRITYPPGEAAQANLHAALKRGIGDLYETVQAQQPPPSLNIDGAAALYIADHTICAEWLTVVDTSHLTPQETEYLQYRAALPDENFLKTLIAYILHTITHTKSDIKASREARLKEIQQWEDPYDTSD